VIVREGDDSTVDFAPRSERSSATDPEGPVRALLRWRAHGIRRFSRIRAPTEPHGLGPCSNHVAASARNEWRWREHRIPKDPVSRSRRWELPERCSPVDIGVLCPDASQTVCARRFMRDTGFVVPGPARFAGISLYLFVFLLLPSCLGASSSALVMVVRTMHPDGARSARSPFRSRSRPKPFRPKSDPRVDEEIPP